MDDDQTIDESPDPSRSGTRGTDLTASRPEGALEPGTVIAERYRIAGFLGKGGMGAVYRASDLQLGQEVAIKILPLAFANDPDQLARFRHEVSTARTISHRHVCRVYDIGSSPDVGHFLTMEFIEGEDLKSLIRRIGRLPGDKGIEIARQLCAALHAVHDQGILHRDLKPANVMLDAQGNVRLTDFGIASLASDPGSIASGTPAYMAPEQLDGREVTVRSDLYALGLV
ncbi:MAG: serine/threonine protein kinase, partial [Phycisphaerales bacterium]|nr:serine/threonine protein kinase [Phycisphaerales bacterium]